MCLKRKDTEEMENEYTDNLLKQIHYMNQELSLL